MKLLALLIWFWFLGAAFGAGVVDCLWAARDGDAVGELVLSTGVLFGAAVFFLVFVGAKQWTATKKTTDAT